MSKVNEALCKFVKLSGTSKDETRADYNLPENASESSVMTERGSRFQTVDREAYGEFSRDQDRSDHGKQRLTCVSRGTPTAIDG